MHYLWQLPKGFKDSVISQGNRSQKFLIEAIFTYFFRRSSRSFWEKMSPKLRSTSSTSTLRHNVGPDRSRVSSIKSSIKIWYSIHAPPSGRVSCPCTSTPDQWRAVVQVTGPASLRVSLPCNPGLPRSSWLQGALPSQTAASTSQEGWLGQDNLSSRPVRPDCVVCSFKLKTVSWSMSYIVCIYLVCSV